MNNKNLPEGWRWVNLGDLGETQMGGTPKTNIKKYWERGEVIWVTPEDMQEGYVNFISKSRRMISLVGLAESSTKLFPSGSVILSTTASIGKVGVALVPLTTNQQLTGIVTNHLVHHIFLAYYLLYLGKDGLSNLGGTTTATHINQSSLRKIPIPLPPLPVQERIVEILQKADEIRQKRKQALELVNKILPALFLEMFGDPATNPKGYEKTTIGAVASMVTSGYTPRGGARNYVQDGPLLLRSQNIKMLSMDLSDCAHLPEAIFNDMERVHVQVGDVLMNITGKGTAGRVTWVADPDLRAAVNQHVCIIRCNQEKVLAPFLAILLSMPHYQAIIERAPGSTQTGFNHSKVRGLEIVIPPMPVQSSFVAQVAALNEAAQKLRIAWEEAEKSFSSLTSQAFTSELTAEWEAANAEWIAQQQALYERLPRLLILALIAEKAKQAHRSAEVLVNALMKYVFLLQMEGSANRRRLYHFVPYHYGPFAKELYADLEKLQEEGLIKVESNREEDKTRITLADPARAEALLADLPEDLREDAMTVISSYGDLDHNSLLQVVYEKYPAYAKKSRLHRRKERKDQ